MVSLFFYAYVILYHKYGNKELFVTCSLFNISLLLLVMAIVRTDFNLAVGFGLFALLSVITIRSAPFSKTEMGYFFGGISLAVINGSGITDYVFVLICNSAVVLSAWCISLWSIEHSANIFDMESHQQLAVVFDRIDPDATNNRVAMQTKLQHMFNLEILSYKVTKIDYVRDTMNIVIIYNIAGRPIDSSPQTGGPDHAQSVKPV
jgi:hypothetical protein